MSVETFLEKCRQVMRLKHLSFRTEETYLPVIRRFITGRGPRPLAPSWGPAPTSAPRCSR